MVPTCTRSDTDHFPSVYSRDEKLHRFNFFSPDIPVLQGSRRMPDWCLHGDAGDNTADPGAMNRDGPCCDP